MRPLAFPLLLLSALTPTTSTSSPRSCPAAPALRDAPTQIAESPPIFVFDVLFTAADADQLIALAKGSLRAAVTKDLAGNVHVDGGRAKGRDSDSTSLLPRISSTPSSDDPVARFRSLMANAALLPESHGEPLQVSRYRRGQRYEVHLDSSATTPRLATVAAFLRTPAEGGELAFPWASRGRFANVTVPGVRGRGRPATELAAGPSDVSAATVCAPAYDALAIRPLVGRVVVWTNHDPQLRRRAYETLHASCPVVSDDEKYIAQLWLRWHAVGERDEFGDVLRSVGLGEWRLAPPKLRSAAAGGGAERPQREHHLAS